MNHGILPAAGKALRLRKLPKFLLPSDSLATTLIEKHIEAMSPFVEIIWLAVRPDLIPLVCDLDLGEKVIPVPMLTETMSETVIKVCAISGHDSFLMGMPDTAYIGDSPYHPRDPSSDLELGLWLTRPAQRGKVGSVLLGKDEKIVDVIDKDSKVKANFHWGTMNFNLKFLENLDARMPHPGYAIMPSVRNFVRISTTLNKGSYYDCGTFDEYREYINDNHTKKENE